MLLNVCVLKLEMFPIFRSCNTVYTYSRETAIQFHYGLGVTVCFFVCVTSQGALVLG